MCRKKVEASSQLPWITGGWGLENERQSGLAFFYSNIFLWLAAERDKNSIWVSVNRRSPPKNKKNKNEKQISRLTNAVSSVRRFAYEIGEVKGPVEGCCNNYRWVCGFRVAFPILIFYAFSTCQIARQSIDAHQACLILELFLSTNSPRHPAAPDASLFVFHFYAPAHPTKI